MSTSPGRVVYDETSGDSILVHEDEAPLWDPKIATVIFRDVGGAERRVQGHLHLDGAGRGLKIEDTFIPWHLLIYVGRQGELHL